MIFIFLYEWLNIYKGSGQGVLALPCICSFYLKYTFKHIWKCLSISKKHCPCTSLHFTCSWSRFKKTDFLCGMCKKYINLTLKQAFLWEFFPFFHMPQKMYFFHGTLPARMKCGDIWANSFPKFLTFKFIFWLR
jgi:hypothetical protein